jgi:hypothetical protein
MRHRTIFPYVMIGLSLLLLLIFIAVAEGNDTPETLPVFVQENPGAPIVPQVLTGTFDAPQVTDSVYEAGLNAALEDLRIGSYVDVVQSNLLGQVVPEGYKSVHLDLVLFLAGIEGPFTLQHQADLEALLANYAWLNR